MERPDVVYIHPSKHPVGFNYYEGNAPSSPYLLMPVGVAGLANLLREHGYSVAGINYPLEVMLNPSYDLQRALAGFPNPRLVMIDLHWYEHAYGAIDVARTAKRALPDARVALGGLTASAYAKEIVKSSSAVDFVIRGDAEAPILRLLDQLEREKPRLDTVPNLTYRANGHAVENPQTYCASSVDLEKLSFVELDFLAHAREYRRSQYVGTEIANPANPSAFLAQWLPTGRGCRFNCSFCGGGANAQRLLAGRNGIVKRPAARVAEEVIQLSRNGVHQVGFTLDLAILGEDYWQSLFEVLRSQNTGIGLYNEHFQLPSKQFVEAFSRVADRRHSQLALTPLVGSEKVRRLNGKLYSNPEFLAVLAELRRYEIPIFVYFSLNLPGEDDKSFEKTLDLAGRVADSYPPQLLKMINMCHTVDPLSPMSVHPEQYAVEVSLRTFQDYYEYCRQTPRARPDARAGDLRGFTAKGRRLHALEIMAARWAEFCRGQQCQCYPVPPTW